MRHPLRIALVLAALATALASSPASAQSADVAVTKSGPAEAAADTDVSYTVGVTNLGPDDAATVTLTDPIPAGMTFVSATPGGCTTPSPGSGGTITCTIASLPAGSSADFTFVLHVAAATPPGTFFTNIASVTSATFDPNSENDSGVAVTATPPPPQADVGVSKTGPTSAGPGTNVAFTILITNAGPDTATGVTWSDVLPGTMTFVSLAPGGGPGLSCSTPAVGSGGTVSCTLASLAANTTATFTLTGQVPPGTPSDTVFTNSATASAATADPNEENGASTTIVTVSTVDLSVTKAGPGAVSAGGNVTYTLTLANAGPDLAVNVQLVDPLPPATTFVSLSQDTGPLASCVTPAPGATGTVACSLGTMASGASAQFTLVVAAGNTASITNTVSAGSDSFETDPADNTASASTTVTPSADLAVTKSGPASVTAGTSVSYTVTVANLGVSDAAGVSLSDAVAAPLAFVSESQTGGPPFTCLTPAAGGVGTIACTIATLPAGASATFSIVLGVPFTVSGSIANTASVGAATSDPAAGNNSATATTSVLPPSTDLSVVKTGQLGGSAIDPPATYTIVVTNHGPDQAEGVVVTDVLPAGATLQSAATTQGACTGTTTVTCTLGTLAAGGSATITLVVGLPPTAGAVANTATVTSATSDPDPANNSSTADVTRAASIPVLSPLTFALLALTLAVVGLVMRRGRRSTSG